MWCDNCLLILPLKGGAIAWGILVALYSIAGGVFLLINGQYFFFFYPEWQIYGGIGIGIGALAVINIFALSNGSYTWTRVCKFLWPFLIIISTLRAILMIVQLNREKGKIAWECANGGALWTESSDAGYSNGTSFPSAFCVGGAQSLVSVFVISLLVDIVCQTYMYFLNWRFQKRIEHYSSLKTVYS